jgi:general stress protein 26
VLATARWTDEVDEILAGDQAVMLASVTPARGVVMTPVTNFATRDREAATVTVNSSVGAWRKLDRIRRRPQVALAFHTRAHAASDRPEYVLVQGTATLSEPIPDYPAALGDRWDRRGDPRPTAAICNRWMRVYNLRVEVTIAVERVTVWPDIMCRGTAQTLGAAAPLEPAPQRPPRGGVGPRVAVRRAGRLPHVLLGWVDADGLPFMVPVAMGETGPQGIRLAAASGLLPPGGRRAGLTAHAFTATVLGQQQQVMTGWLQVDGDTIAYAPHTLRAYRLPPSLVLYRLVVGLETRRRYRESRTVLGRSSEPGGETRRRA